MNHCILVMGVSGCGKTTVAKLLSEKLGVPFIEADDFHLPSNVEKMKNGISLDDADRLPWLKILGKEMAQHESSGFVIACSALKKSYRDLLNSELKNNLQIIFLEGSFEKIRERLENRKGHFMGSKLLQSQFDDLEIPMDAITVNVENDLFEILNNIEKQLINSE